MDVMQRRWSAGAALLLCCCATVPPSARDARMTGTQAREGEGPVLDVPVHRGEPVLVDGQLDPGEWSEALAVSIAAGVTLLLKGTCEQLYAAVRTEGRVPRPVDVFLQLDTGETQQLHASMAIGERRLSDLPWSDTMPVWIWGNHVDWIANEAKQDSRRESTLRFDARLFPADGVELQLRRRRFSGNRLRLRVEVGEFVSPGRMDIFPAQSSRASVAGWADLRLDGLCAKG